MDEQDIRNKIKAAIAKISDIEAADITDTASFRDDLGLDSLVLLEISVENKIRLSLCSMPWSGMPEVEHHATDYRRYRPGAGDVYWHRTGSVLGQPAYGTLRHRPGAGV